MKCFYIASELFDDTCLSRNFSDVWKQVPIVKAITDKTSIQWLLNAFDDHFQTIYAYLARRVGRDVADDLTSEVFVVAFKRQSTFDEAKGSVVGWLYGIATNLLRNHRRAEIRQLAAYARHAQEITSNLATAALSNDHSNPVENEVIAYALSCLSHEQRDVLLLSAWSDLSYAEIARSLQTPIGTVRSRLARARAEMQRQLEIQEQEMVQVMPEAGVSKWK